MLVKRGSFAFDWHDRIYAAHDKRLTTQNQVSTPSTEAEDEALSLQTLQFLFSKSIILCPKSRVAYKTKLEAHEKKTIRHSQHNRAFTTLKLHQQD